MLDEDGLEAIHDASMPILEEHGLESFEPPPLEPAIDEELTAYVAKRKEAIAADRA